MHISCALERKPNCVRLRLRAVEAYNLQAEINGDCHPPASRVFIGVLARIAGWSDQSPVLIPVLLALCS